MSETHSTLRSIGELARHLGIETYQVEYIVDKHRIEPETRAAGIRLFGETAVKQIRDVIAQRQAANGAA